MNRPRLCARPGCGSPAEATLSFEYGNRTVFVDDLGVRDPHSIDLCSRHADRTAPPRGWTGHDRRMSSAPVAVDLDDSPDDALRAAAS